MSVEILFLAFNRKAFTQVSFGLLLEHTDWSLVDRLVVYDDGSKDGTAEWLEDALEQSVVDNYDFRRTKHGSPVEVMIDYLARTDCDVFAKIDSDIALPDGWLSVALPVIDAHPDLGALGLAAGWTGVKEGEPGILPCSHIGGVGLIRREKIKGELWSHGRYGWTEYQHRTLGFHSAWLTPDLPVVQLDLIPAEPWRSLADYYCAKSWARPWPPYAEESSEWWSWIPEPALV